MTKQTNWASVRISREVLSIVRQASRREDRTCPKIVKRAVKLYVRSIKGRKGG